MRDRVISAKFLAHRVHMQDTLLIFKNISSFQNDGHFEFSNFWQKWWNLKLLVSPKPREIERFWRNFWSKGYTRYSAQFSKIFPLSKNGGHFQFSNFWQKWKNFKLLVSPKSCGIKWFQQKFRSTGYLRKILCPIFKKFSSFQKCQPFEILKCLPKT